MIRRHHGEEIPIEIYHGVPKGWAAREIVAAHAGMRGTFSIEGPEATEPGAPSWMPERYEWLQYRATLYRVADGVRAGDTACVELAIRYIELGYIGSYSGYIRAKLARRLVAAAIDERQKVRLNDHFFRLVTSRNYSEEFSQYVRLWKNILTDGMLAKLRSYGATQQRPDDNTHATPRPRLQDLITRLERR